MATWVEIDRATLPKPKELDLAGYQLLLVGSKEFPLGTFLNTFRSCQDMKNLAKHWKKLGACLGVPPKIIYVLDKEDSALRKSQAIYELIKKWSNLKREEGHELEANLKTLIECIHKTGTFSHIAKELQRPFDKQVKCVLLKQDELKLKENSKEDPMPPKELEWSVIGKIQYNESAIIHQESQTVVFRGQFENGNVAVKRMTCGSKEEMQTRLKDAELLLNRVDGHKSLLKYHGMERDCTCIYLAFDLYDGTLEQGVEKQIPNVTLNRLTSLQVVHQITEGVAHLHRNNMVHGNLNPSNVLLVGEEKGNIVHAKIAYIDYAKLNDTEKDSDIFALGCLFFFVLSGGKHLFENNDSKQKGTKKNDDINPKLTSWLIQEMTDNDPKKRPKADVILSHPMFWEREKTLNFLLHVADILSSAKTSKVKAIAKEIEKNADLVNSKETRHHLRSYQDWLKLMNMDVKKYHESYSITPSRTDSKLRLNGFLQLIKNLARDYDKLPDHVKKVIGAPPDQFVDYWELQFPLLVPVTWIIVHKLRNDTHDHKLMEYYGNHEFKFPLN